MAVLMTIVENISGETTLLVKVVMFLLVQALVYLILTSSSDIFSKNEKTMRSSFSFKTVRSASVRRILAALSDFPPPAEPSPSSSSLAGSRSASSSALDDSVEHTDR